MNTYITLCLVIVGVVNIVPLLGIFSAAKIEDAYGVKIASKDMEILMRHRALLFGIVGGFILYAAFVPAFHIAAMVLGGVSMVGFAVLARLVGDYNQRINKVVIADLAGIAVLLVAVVLKAL